MFYPIFLIFHWSSDATLNRMNAKILSSLHKADTSDCSSQNGSLDPEIQAYFFINRNTGPHCVDSVPVSPLFPNSRALTTRSWTSRWSQKSGESKRSNCAKSGSIRSSPSFSTPYQKVDNWQLKRASDTPPLGLQSTSHTSVDPPRPPRAGFEWVWFPEGYWAERERPGISPSKQTTKKKWWNRSPGRQSKASRHTDANTTQRNRDMPKIKIGRIVSRRASSSNRRKSENDSQKSSTPLSSITFVGSTTPPNWPIGPRERLYCKVKRNIKKQLFQQPKPVKSNTS
jgi:parafibromin